MSIARCYPFFEPIKLKLLPCLDFCKLILDIIYLGAEGSLDFTSMLFQLFTQLLTLTNMPCAAFYPGLELFRNVCVLYGIEFRN